MKIILLKSSIPKKSNAGLNDRKATKSFYLDKRDVRQKVCQLKAKLWKAQLGITKSEIK